MTVTYIYLRPLELTGEIPMVEFQKFMSIGLSKCGSDESTFAGLVAVWNDEKEQISKMTVAEVRDELVCP